VGRSRHRGTCFTCPYQGESTIEQQATADAIKHQLKNPGHLVSIETLPGAGKLSMRDISRIAANLIILGLALALIAPRLLRLFLSN